MYVGVRCVWINTQQEPRFCKKCPLCRVLCQLIKGHGMLTLRSCDPWPFAYYMSCWVCTKMQSILQYITYEGITLCEVTEWSYFLFEKSYTNIFCLISEYYWFYYLRNLWQKNIYHINKNSRLNCRVMEFQQIYARFNHSCNIVMS